MKRTIIPYIFPVVAVATVLALGAVAVTRVKPCVPLWTHRSGLTLTQVELLPQRYWGFGTMKLTMTTATGAPVDGGSRTMYGCLAVYDYDLRVWQYDPKSGMVYYDTN